MTTGSPLRKLLVPTVLAGLVGLAALGTSALPATAAPSGSGVTNSGGTAGSNNNGANGTANSASGETHSSVAVCSSAPAGYARCNSWRRTDSAAVNSSPAGRGAPAPSTIGSNGAYGPAWLQSAYGAYGATGGSGQTVAIVDAYDDPNAYSDMSSYRSYWGLPACSNTAATGNPCFRKVNESGSASPLPSANSSWGQEISLDLDMVSAICPNCSILLVEANSAYYSDLGTAVNTAVAMGAQQVSNSYGGSEFNSESTMDSAYYDHPGTAIVASSGDNGYGVEYPAASPYVTAAGGTTLTQTGDTGTRNATETAWSGAGSGCSAYEPKPSWQTDTGCSRRTVADVSADADPNTGVWVYDTYGTGGTWGIFGGTSVASPIIASFFALGGAAGANTANPPSWPYAAPTALNDIVGGSNGRCSITYLCNAVTGYDGPTGLGTPIGTPAFNGTGSTSGGGGGGTGGGGGGTPAPGAFTLSAKSDPSHGVDLSWTLSSNATGYTVLRGLKSNSLSTYTTAVTCTSSGCTYHDTNTKSRTTYWYEVAATNTTGTTNSNEVSAKAR